MAATKDIPVEETLHALYKLQEIDSKIDEIRIMKGELPMEVEDLEDEITGLETRKKKLAAEAEGFEDTIADYKAKIKQGKTLITKYKKQLDNVKNNREYEALTKEIENQELDNQLFEKRIKDAKESIDAGAEAVTKNADTLKERKKHLSAKQGELEKIVKETEKEEESLQRKSNKAQKEIPDRFMTAYARIRKSYKNGLAVSMVARQACSGCFNQIPPQTQLEIRQRKRIITCEHCGRILVDNFEE